MPHALAGVAAPLAVCAILAVPPSGVPGEAAAGGAQAMTIKGSLTYLQRIALPPDSRALVELRDSTAPERPVLAEQRIELKGRQVPIPFELSVDRARLAAGKRYVVRGTIVSAGRPSWVSEDVAVNVAGGDVDLGILKLAQARTAPPSTPMICGGQRISVSIAGDTARVTMGAQILVMRQVKTASGAKYEVEKDSSTSFWSKGANATLVVKGKTFPECTPDKGGAASFSATGNEPGWRLDLDEGQLTLQADYGKTRVAMTAPPAETVPGGRKYTGTAGSHTVAVTILDRLCADSMTGLPRPNTVEVLLDGKLFKGCGGDPAVLLRGAAWVVQTIDEAPVGAKSKVTMSFGDPGRVAGGASCNTYSGGYTLTAEGLTFSRVASTLKACAPDLMKQEQAFLTALRSIQRFDLSADGVLTLHGSDKHRIVARRE
jgi:heat shock protein HslJ/uncharacterized lipoprotein YbaY/uncharacterized membrane protein